MENDVTRTRSPSTHPGLFIALASLCLLLVAILAIVLVPATAHATEAAGQTVRVGYYYDSDYYYKGDDGIYGGYDAEYFYEISKYTNWQYQYVDFDSFEDAYAALESGQIDVLPSLFNTPERAESLLLSSYDMGSVYVTIIVSPSNDAIAYDDSQALQGKRVGILADSVDGEKYREWAGEQGISTEVVPMATTEELLGALDDGSLDAVAISYLGSSSTYRIVKEFSPMKMYLGMPKDHAGLMSQLNAALESITIETPDFSSELYRKYYIANQQQTPVFTASEKAYIASAGTLTVAVLNDNQPFSYLGGNGEMTGAVVDYFGKISQLSGLSFSYRGYPSQAAAVQAVKSGEADIVGSMVYDATEATADKILLTNSFIDMALTEITLQGTGQIRTIAVPSYLLPIVQGSFSGQDVSFETFGSAAECMAAVGSGKVDGAILSTYSANYYMNTNRAGTYNVTTLNGLSCRLASGLPSTTDRSLASVLNRCIRYSNSTTMNELVIGYSQADSSTLRATLNRIPVAWLLAIAAIMCCFAVVLVILLMTVRRRQREREALAAQRAAVAQKEAELAAAERAGEERNRFFSNISHDMRTPLNAVIGFSDLAERETDVTRKNEYLEKIGSSGKLLLDLIDDTLTISRASQSGIELHLKPVLSSELFSSVIPAVREAASKRIIEFTVDMSEARNRVVMADRLGVEKIFLNLLSNAVKYTPEGGHVSLHVFNDPPDGADPVSVLVVSDDGIGISPEFLPHIYEPFEQEKQHGYESVGTGLGLSIVKQLVDKMGGTIDVESEQGKGTTFTVRLHFEEPPEGAEPPDAIQGGLHDVDLAGRKVLLCEDNALNREVAVALLGERDVDVTVVEDGLAGVTAFSESAEGHFDAILMDIRMPVMDGYEAARRIRSLDRADAATVPIIAMSADAYDDDVRRCHEAGMNGHVAKPVDVQRLYQAIQEAIGERDSD
ncbi:MAG: transporter substrate-binding domain-containing protein [Atopobiaceae bacterium]|jgi:signal transduction histidine kinase/ActR/RegA family two-component response regulator